VSLAPAAAILIGCPQPSRAADPMPSAQRRRDPRRRYRRGDRRVAATARTARASALARSAPELQAKSRHAYLASLGRYVQLGEQTSAQVTANADPAARRKPR